MLRKWSRPAGGAGVALQGAMGLALLLPKQPGTEVTFSLLLLQGDLAPLARAVPDATTQLAVSKIVCRGKASSVTSLSCVSAWSWVLC